MQSNLLRKLLAVCAVLIGASCASNPTHNEQRTESLMNRIGVVHLSLGQPIPLEKIREKLKPQFDVTGEKAVQLALPTEAAALRYTLDSVVASLRVAGPSKIDTTRETGTSEQNKTNEVRNTSGGNDQGASQSSTSKTDSTTNTSNQKTETTKERGVGDATKVNTPSTQEQRGGVPDRQLPDISSIALGSDPILRYLNAMSVLTAVSALNEVAASIQPPKGWKAYVVPVRVSLSPLGRNLPYELRTTIVFSGVVDSAAGPKVVAGLDQPSARVVPLGIDSHGAMSQTSAEDIARSFGLGLSWIAGLTGIGGDIGKISQATNGYRGIDIHSVMTAGQSGENSVDVRFGAMRTGEDTFSAVERSYLLVLVVMVPQKSTEILATGTNSFVHTSTGATVSSVDNSSVVPELYRTLRSSYNIDPADTVCKCDLVMEIDKQQECQSQFSALKQRPVGEIKDADFSPTERDALRRVQQLAQYGRISALAKCVGLASSMAPTAGYTTVNLAASLMRTMDESRYSKALAALPDESTATPILPPSQTVLLRDNGQQTTGTIAGGRDIDAARHVAAFLTVGDTRVGATAVVTTGSTLTLTFPSLDGFLAEKRSLSGALDLYVDAPKSARYVARYLRAGPATDQPAKKQGK